MNNELQNDDFILPGELGTLAFGNIENDITRIFSRKDGSTTLTVIPKTMQHIKNEFPVEPIPLSFCGYALKVYESSLFPFELGYDACNVETKQEIKISSGEMCHGVMVPEERMENHLERPKIDSQIAASDNAIKVYINSLFSIKPLFVILFVLLFTSCTKETSFETHCGIVTGKDLIRNWLYVDGKKVETGLIQVNLYQIGDTYCP